MQDDVSRSFKTGFTSKGIHLNIDGAPPPSLDLANPRVLEGGVRRRPPQSELYLRGMDMDPTLSRRMKLCDMEHNTMMWSRLSISRPNHRKSIHVNTVYAKYNKEISVDSMVANYSKQMHTNPFNTNYCIQICINLVVINYSKQIHIESAYVHRNQ